MFREAVRHSVASWKEDTVLGLEWVADSSRKCVIHSERNVRREVGRQVDEERSAVGVGHRRRCMYVCWREVTVISRGASSRDGMGTAF